MSEKEKNTEELDDIVNETVETGENKTENEVTEETVNENEVKLAELSDKYLRLYSEFENYRKRTAKEKLEMIGTASEGVMKDLLTIMDDFERAIESNDTSEDLTAIKDGVKLIAQKFHQILTIKGLKEIETSEGSEFNVDLHEAITKIPAPSKDLKGKIVAVVEKGYTLHEKIIRYPKVVIGE